MPDQVLMTAKRVLTLVTAVCVLAVAWYASRRDLEVGIVVAVAGLGATFSLGVLAIPAAALFAATALYVPGVGVVLLFALVLMGFNLRGRWPIELHPYIGWWGGWRRRRRRYL